MLLDEEVILGRAVSAAKLLYLLNPSTARVVCTLHHRCVCQPE
jgi:hypothetical protein